MGGAIAAQTLVWDFNLPFLISEPLQGRSAGAAFVMAALCALGAAGYDDRLASLQLAASRLMAMVSAALADTDGQLEVVQGLQEKLEPLAQAQDRRVVFVALGQPAVPGMVERLRFCESITAIVDELAPQHLAQPGASAPAQAGATLLAHARPVKQPTAIASVVPVETGQALRAYLEWLVALHATLELPGVGQPGPGSEDQALRIRLEQVFVALRARPAGRHELSASTLAINELRAGSARDTVAALEPGLAAEGPTRASDAWANAWLESDRLDDLLVHTMGGQSLDEFFCRQRRLVILGDPGSGKTTLARWLVLQLAAALLAGQRSLELPTCRIDSESPYDTRPKSLGPARLPVLVRISEFAQALHEADRVGRQLSLEQWLVTGRWRDAAATADPRCDPAALREMIQGALERGEAVIVLDGLDEVGRGADRARVVEQIERFASHRIPVTVADAGPGHAGGNQLVVTSRITGYRQAPLVLDQMEQVTIVAMTRPAVEHFCDAFLDAAYEARFPMRPLEQRMRLARSASQALQRAIFDPARPGIALTAVNPLLVSLLASLFLMDEGRLPASRVELYEAMVDHLIAVWSKRVQLPAVEIRFVLEGLAVHLHDHAPTGVIGAAAMQRLATHRLAEWRAAGGGIQSRSAAEDATALVESLDRLVGVVAARGEDQIGFLHLTFEEYLAGCAAVRDPHAAAQMLQDRMNHPRWREPVLLGLGQALSSWSEAEGLALLDSLLEMPDPLRRVIPRAALAAAESICGIGAPHASHAALVILHLLTAYADRQKLDRFVALRREIEDALLRLRRAAGPEIMDRVLSNAMRGGAGAGQPDVPLAVASAALVSAHGWTTPAIVEALHDGLDLDSGAWDWPFERTLRQLVAPESPVPVPEPVHPEDAVRKVDARLREVHAMPPGDETRRARDELLAQRDRAVADLRRWQGNPLHVRRDLADYYVALAARRRHELRRALHTRGEPVGARLRLRRELAADPALLGQVRSCVCWLAAIAVLDGGYADYRADRVLEDYDKISEFLQLPDATRKRLLQEGQVPWIGHFGNADTVYNAAVHLDTKMGGLLEVAQIPPVFSPEAIYASSPLDDLLLRHLRGRFGQTALIRGLQGLLEADPRPRVRADAVALLAAMGEDVLPLVERGMSDSTTREDTMAALRQLERMACLLDDAVTRARPVILSDLQALNESDPQTWVDIVDPVLLVLCRGSSAALRLYRIVREDGQPEQVDLPWCAFQRSWTPVSG